MHLWAREKKTKCVFVYVIACECCFVREKKSISRKKILSGLFFVASAVTQNDIMQKKILHFGFGEKITLVYSYSPFAKYCDT
jgi:hypothetical protein